MAVYILLFILFLIPAFQESLLKQKNYAFSLVFIFASIIVAVRYQVGNDWSNYVKDYQTTPELSDLKPKHFEREFLYVILVSFFKTIGGGYQILFFFFSILTTGTLLIGIYKFEKKCLFLAFLIYFSYHFLQYEMNMVRHGIAASWMFLAFYYSSQRDFKRYLLYNIIAALFQAFALIFIPFFWLNRINFNWKKLLIITGIGVFVFVSLDLFNVGLTIPFFQNRINYYLDDYYSGTDNTSYGISLGMIFYFVLAIFARFFIFKREYEESMLYRVIINALIYSFVVGVALNSVAIFVERIVGVLNMTSIILLPMIMNRYKKEKKLVIFAFIILYCIFFFRAVLLTPGPMGIGFHYVPYMYKL